MFKLRISTPTDGPSFVRILNKAIEDGKNGYVETLAEKDSVNWYNDLYNNALCLVSVEIESGVVGWGSLTKYRGGRKAFHKTLEISFYVEPTYHHRGIGTAIIEHLEAEATATGIDNLIAILLGNNEPSIGLLMKKGYSEWGRMPDTAFVDGKPLDHLYFGKQLNAPSPSNL